MNDWSEDFLGPDYLAKTITLEPDAEGPRVTTIVKRVHHQSDEHPAAAPTFAFVALHGWNDYFYQRELADSITAAGGAIYGVDLHKYGRSYREWQTFGFTEDLTSYDDDLHAAFDTIAHDIGPDVPIFLYGHSTGGLIATLWADRHPGALAGLVLNSPWLELQASTTFRKMGAPILERVARRSAKSIIPTTDNGFYQRVLTAGTAAGETEIPGAPAGSQDPFWTTGWQPDPRFRTMPTWPTRVGWLAAIFAGQTRVAEGLAIDCPILVLTSARSISHSEWTEDFRQADGVLDVQQIWKRVPLLGQCVTLYKLPGAIHDVTFSQEPVRNRAFETINRFVVNALA